MKSWGTMQKIKEMIESGASVSKVARELKIDRKTVRKYREMTLEDFGDYRRNREKRPRAIDEYEGVIEEIIDEMKRDGLINAQSIYDRLRDMGFKGSARSVRRFVKQYRRASKQRRIYKPFETEPGAQAMVDLGEKRGVEIGGVRRAVHLIVMVLSHGRYKFCSWFQQSPSTEDFLQFHNDAFREFGGVPQEILYDQTKLAVLNEEYGEHTFNEEFLRYSRYMGYKLYICRKHDPETKGKVEAAVGYIKKSFLLGRTFSSWADLQRQWDDWSKRIGNAKIHEITRESPRDALQRERPFLTPMATQWYRAQPAYKKHKVYKDGLVKVLGNRYSVPSSHHDKTVLVRVTEAHIEVVDMNKNPLCVHARCLEKGKRFLDREHYRRRARVSGQELEEKVLACYGSQAMLERLKKHYPRHFKDQYRGMLKLAEAYPRPSLETALRRLLHHDCLSYGNMKQLLIKQEEEANREVELPVTLNIQMPLDLGLEERPISYYDRATAGGGQ